MDFRKLFALIFTILMLTPLGARAYEVTALITDSIGETEPFATYRIVSLADSTLTLHGVADEQGVATKELASPGEYAFTVTAVGKQPSERRFNVSDAEPRADLGTIVLTASGRELGEVQVTAMKPLVSREIDRIGYDVQGDSENKTSKLSEMLNKVPLVSVDPDGTIRVKGSTSFKVYKNGKPNKAMSTNAKDMFKSLPASMIKKIEVITDPGAREDAEGSTAILNIVMMENTYTSGAIGTVGLRYDTDNNYPTPNLWMSAQLNKFSLSAYGGMGLAQRRSTQWRSRVTADYLLTDDQLQREQHGDSEHRSYYGGLEASFELDTLNLFTIEGNFFQFRNFSDTWSDVVMKNAAGQPIYSYKQHDATSPSKYLDLSMAANYQHSTRRKGEALIVSYMLSTTNQGSNSTMEMTDIVNNPVKYTGSENDFDLNFIEHTGQIDWKRPLDDKQTLEVGSKFIYRRNHSTNHQEYVGLGRDTTDYFHHTYVGAAYADYRVNINRWGARVGLRYELSHLSSDAYDETHPAYSSTLNDLCPQAALSYRINDKNSLRLGYSTSISRPGISYLNPAVIVTPLNHSQGNPDLNSALSQSFNLNYSFFTRKVMIDFSMGYNFCNNGIIEDRHVGDDNITYSTYTNGGRSRGAFAGAYIRINAGSKTNITFNGNLRYNYMRNSSLDLSNKGWSGSCFMYVVQQLPWKLRLSGNINYYNSNYGGLYNETHNSFSNSFGYSLNLQRSFLNDRLTASIGTWKPIWYKENYSRNTTRNLAVNWNNETWRRHRPSLMINLSYRFGSMNIQVKKTAASISNNDLEGRKN